MKPKKGGPPIEDATIAADSPAASAGEASPSGEDIEGAALLGGARLATPEGKMMLDEEEGSAAQCKRPPELSVAPPKTAKKRSIEAKTLSDIGSSKPRTDSIASATIAPCSPFVSSSSSPSEAPLVLPLVSHRDALFDPTITLFDRAQFKRFLILDKEQRSQKPKRVRSSLNSLTLEEQVELAIRLSLGQAAEEDSAR